MNASGRDVVRVGFGSSRRIWHVRGKRSLQIVSRTQLWVRKIEQDPYCVSSCIQLRMSLRYRQCKYVNTTNWETLPRIT